LDFGFALDCVCPHIEVSLG